MEQQPSVQPPSSQPPIPPKQTQTPAPQPPQIQYQYQAPQAQYHPQPQNQQQYYGATLPVEPPLKNPGRVEGIISIICAVMAILFFPIIFGPVGIILGSVSLKKGSKTLGLVAIILSAVFMGLGFVLGYLALMNNPATGGFIGLLLSF